MPYRRRRRRRRKSKKSKQFRFRMGQFGPSGGKPLVPNSKIYKCVTASQIAVSATTAGDTGCYSIGNYNQPLEFHTTTSFTGGDLHRHPSGHEQAIAQGFATARVMKTLYRFDVRFIGTSAADKDFVFAYKFGTDTTAAATIGSTTTTVELWNDMRQTRGWVWKRFSGTESGGSEYPSAGTVIVKVPHVSKLILAMHKNLSTGGSDITIMDTVTPINDVADETAEATRSVFLHILVMTVDGQALVAKDIVIDVTCYQTVKLMRPVNNAQMIDEGDEGAG